MECSNCDEEADNLRLCAGCDLNICGACYILHNEDLDAEYDGGFVVINAVTNQVLEQETDEATVFYLRDAREFAAQLRADCGHSDFHVYRVVGVGPVGEED